MTSDTIPDWDTIAEQEIESLRDAMPAALEGFSRLLAWLERGRPGPLCTNGRAYARRRAARKKRRR